MMWWKFFFLVSFLLFVSVSAQGTVNKSAVLKRNAKKRAKEKFLEKHSTVFDSYGRVIKLGREVKKVECKPHKNEKIMFTCEVTDWEDRKYRTREDELRQKLLKLDKQAELDKLSGDTSESAERKRRYRRESRTRCTLYKQWVVEYAKSKDDAKKRHFWNYLSSNYNDFGELRRLSPGKRSVRRAKKIYRHIALQTHADKLPECAKTDEIKDMMRTIMGKAEYLKNCVENPHECDEKEL
eukprot:g5259.t1